MFGSAPGLVAEAPQDPRGTVVQFHGLGADALAMLKELALVRGAGSHAVGTDAPMHGRRHHDDRDHRWAQKRPRPTPTPAGKVLCIQAGHDEAVDGRPTYRFIDRLRERGEDASLEVLEGSTHTVPEAQWWGAWDSTLRWMSHRI